MNLISTKYFFFYKKSFLSLVFPITAFFSLPVLAADTHTNINTNSHTVAHTMPHNVVQPKVFGYTTIKGDTLDKVINKMMHDSPIKISLLRQAFVQTNPTAFISNNPNRMLAGVTLTSPDVTPILQAALLRLDSKSGEPSHEFKPTTKEDRRQWIRYP